MMRLILLMIATGLTTVAGAQSLKRVAADANAAYNEEAYLRADSLYGVVRAQAPGDFAYTYNTALTKYRLTQLDSAEALFTLALAQTDSMQATVHYNLGNTALMDWVLQDLELEHVAVLLEEASASKGLSVQERLTKFLEKDSLLVVQQTLLDGKEAALGNAINHYKSTLRLHPSDEDARYNLLFARGKIPPPPGSEPPADEDEPENDSPEDTRVKDLKTQAFEYIREGKFEQAFNLLNGAKQRNPELNGLDGLLDKLGLVLEILYDT